MFKSIKNEGRFEASLIRDWNAVTSRHRMETDEGAEKRELVEASLLGGILALLLAFGLFVFSRKKAGEKLKDCERRYQSLTESANDAIISADKAGNIVFLNKGAMKLFGYEENEVMGMALTMLMPERYRKAHSEGIARATSTGQFKMLGKTMELCGLKKDGVEFPLEISVASWNSGEGVFFNAIIRDITKRREAELELNILRNAVEQAAEMVVITDHNGAIEYVNPAFERLTGYSTREAIGSNPRMLTSGRQPREFYEELWGNIKAGRIWFGQLINRKKSGEEYHEEMTISPIKGEDGKISHFMAITRDISENMAIRNQLIQAEKLSSIGTLVSGVAHEMNNPLTAILGYSEMLLSKGGDLPDDVAKGLGVIHQQAERTSKIVRDLLRFSRKQDVEKTSLEISDVLEGVFSLQAHHLRTTNIECLKEYGAGQMRVFGNMSQLQQVFLNIIQNGAHEMRRAHGKGVMAVRTEMRDGEALVLLENDGPPIPPDVMGRLFDPFFTTKGVGEGTGLGLSISYGIVKDHGGRLWAENIGESGVRFVVALPLDGSEISANRTVNKPSGPELSGRCVLLVEDEQAVRKWLLTLLRKNGAVVHSSKNGKEAIELIKKNDYDLIISDLKMPEMDGFKVGNWLREHRPEQFRRFILITGTIDSEVVEYSGNFGCRVLQKPFSQDELFASIRETSGLPSGEKPR
ncbi:MAG: PAS domain S-box protein [Nitrospinae bacterium]|nr:PAS domain S-box protein [Nitrospinota bacterium]